MRSGLGLRRALARRLRRGHVGLGLRAPERGARLAAPVVVTDPDAAVRTLRALVRRAGRVFLDIDCDVFDPSCFPATAHPLPFGLTPPLFLRLLDAAWTDRVCGVALSEFDPGRDRADQGLSTLIWLIEYLFLKRFEARAE